jgi:hypothetical protein
VEILAGNYKQSKRLSPEKAACQAGAAVCGAGSGLLRCSGKAYFAVVCLLGFSI